MNSNRQFLAGLILAAMLASCSSGGGGGGGGGSAPGAPPPTPLTADPWTVTQVNPIYTAITFGNGTYVAVGISGAAAASTNGTTWTPSMVPGAATAAGIVFANGAFLTVSTAGTTATSTDGIAWTAHGCALQPGSTQCQVPSPGGLAFAGTKYWVTAGGWMYSSSNGVNWTQQSSLGPVTGGRLAFLPTGESMLTMPGNVGVVERDATGSTINLVFLSGSGFANQIASVAAGNNGSKDILLAVSNHSGSTNNVVTWDGTTTNEYSGPNDNLLGVTYGNSLFVAVGATGKVWTSPDGVTWANPASATTARLTAVAAGGTLGFAAAGAYSTIVTADVLGATWTSRNAGSGPQEFFSIAQNGTATMVATGLTSASSNSCELLTSVNSGAIWTLTGPIPSINYGPQSGPCATAIPAGSGWAVAGPGYLAANTVDPAITGDWIQAPVGFTPYRIRALGTSMHLLAAVATTDTAAYRTTDGFATASAAFTGTGAALHDIAWNGLASGAGGVWVAVGDYGYVMRSIDGNAWTAAANTTALSASDTLKGVAYCAACSASSGPLFVTVGTTTFIGGTDGVTYYSANGDTWTKAAAGLSSPANTWGLNAVTFDGSEFVAVGNLKLIGTSSDGDIWTLSNRGSISAVPYLTGIAYDGGSVWVAVGSLGARYASAAPADAATSWTDHSAGSASIYYNDVIWSASQSRFIAVAQDRTSVSTDGVTWSDIGTNAAGQSLAESGGKVYSLLGSVVTQIAANNTLTTVVNDFGASISTVRYLNGLYLAPGSGVMARSADGLAWTLGFLAPGLTSFTGNDIAFGSGLYVYVTAYGSTVYTSPDLVTWTPRTLPAPGSAGPASVAFGGGTFVILSTASSYAVTFSSPDGIAWTAGTDNHALVDSQYSGFAAATLLYDGTHFVAARGDGAVLVSADGRAWTGYNPMLPQPLRTISPGAAGAIWGVGDSGLWATHAAY